jgi:DNA-3-methyladenine glycosylase
MISTAPSFPVALLAGETLAAARSLIGARLVRGSGPAARVGRIVEVEAYIGREDRACHARFGRTERNAVMFGAPGRAYVYFVYGMYHCLNVVTEPREHPSAVLIRAVEPVSGLERMRLARAERARRPGAANHPLVVSDNRLASGPGLVCAAFSITRADDGADLCDPESDLRLEPSDPAEAHPPVAAGPRIGIGYAPEPWLSHPWRFYVPESSSVSRPSAGSKAGR